MTVRRKRPQCLCVPDAQVNDPERARSSRQESNISLESFESVSQIEQLITINRSQYPSNLNVKTVSTKSCFLNKLADTSLKTLPHLGVGGLFPCQSKAMCLLTSNKVAVEEEEDGDDAEGSILKSVFSGGGTNRCPDSLTDNILVVEAVTHQHVFKCGRRWWRPFQTSRQRCRQVENVMLSLLGIIIT